MAFGGIFFRAYYYSELIARFGDVPWVDRVLGDSDKEIAYGPRTPRKEVADHVLNDLIYAEEHIKEEGDGENTINVHVVRALLSRFCLLKVHGVNIMLWGTKISTLMLVSLIPRS